LPCVGVGAQTPLPLNIPWPLSIISQHGISLPQSEEFLQDMLHEEWPVESTRQIDPSLQHVSWQARAVGQQAPLTQALPEAQQVVPHDWLSEQQALSMHESVLAQQVPPQDGQQAPSTHKSLEAQQVPPHSAVAHPPVVPPPVAFPPLVAPPPELPQAAIPNTHPNRAKVFKVPPLAQLK
jgi:hypothetical protein